MHNRLCQLYQYLRILGYHTGVFDPVRQEKKMISSVKNGPSQAVMLDNIGQIANLSFLKKSQRQFFQAPNQLQP
jgi:hypothetical protein